MAVDIQLYACAQLLHAGTLQRLAAWHAAALAWLRVGHGRS